MAVEVLHGGLMTTVQDAGRHGLYSQGFPPSGAMDDFSFRVANLLVGNDENAAALEATYMGPRLRFRETRTIALTGADMPAQVDGLPRPAWEAFEVNAGETLTFDYLKGGARTYIAVAGGFEVPEVLGSRSTYARVGLGGHDGRAVVEGDVLAVGEARVAGAKRIGARVDDWLRPTFQREVEVRIMVGLYSHRLTQDSLRAFLDS
ncbi:MAG: biotin-dependent carboxyltransferase family protein, partial [Chloroflexi bacterium]|nr:biotin-dependent carboxyltransferase family protein [Chloroflexota bacterium]